MLERDEGAVKLPLTCLARLLGTVNTLPLHNIRKAGSNQNNEKNKKKKTRKDKVRVGERRDMKKRNKM